MADKDKKYTRNDLVRRGLSINGSSERRSNAGRVTSNGRDKASGHGAGWDAYRGWLTNMDRTASRRRGARNVYTWKGYKAWAAKIRATWDADNADN